jgi:tyrosinase
MKSHPLFDGSDTSMSGDGEKVPQQGDIALIQPNLPTLWLPTADGGGCVKSGPFKDWKVNMGPQQLSIPGGEVIGAPSGNALDYNPRCLKRDLTDAINRRYANASSVLRNLGEKTIGDFQGRMQGNIDFSAGDIGIHGGE